MKKTAALSVALGILFLSLVGVVKAQAPDGQRIYESTCAVCHDAGLDRAPDRETLALLPPEAILAALERGNMVSMAVTLSTAQRRIVAEHLAGRPLTAELSFTPSPAAMCARQDSFTAGTPLWQGWGGVGLGNGRYQSAGAGLTAEDVAKLKVKWAFAYPGDIRAYAPPTVAGGRLFVGSAGGVVYSLDAKTGCVHWYHEAGAEVRTATTIATIESGGRTREAVFFGDQRAFAHAVDAATGEEIWRTKVDDYPLARLSSSPIYHAGRLYVGVASGEEAAGAAPAYECCRFRGSLVALNAATGAIVWKTYTVDPPQPTTKNAVGTQLWGPSGAPIWSSPAVDPERNVVYATTGNNYSNPATPLSDAFVAFDLDTGRIRWSRQMTEGDAWIAACRLEDKTNCPDAEAPDFDFGASPILVTLADGKDLVVAGQKSGVVHALDPDRDGALVWQQRVGQGGSMGGVQWGSATDGERMYVAVSDIRRIPVKNAWATEADRAAGGGMFALDLRDGARVWYTPPAPCDERPRCAPAQPGAVSAIPGVAFSGSMDGHLRAYSTADGSILLDLDTIRAYTTVNGVPGQGGSLDGAGPTIADGIVYVNSGYPNGGGMPGNVLLALTVDGR
ncbi:MAG TPA: PQQ-binding-like beta-propeller repeat protein [Gammaproteobacteria bacterium]